MSSKCKFSFFVLTHSVVYGCNFRNNDFLTNVGFACFMTLFCHLGRCACRVSR